jgi:hypothetical protein
MAQAYRISENIGDSFQERDAQPPWSDCWPDSVNNIEDKDKLEESASKNAPGIVLREVACVLAAILMLIVAVNIGLRAFHIY